MRKDSTFERQPEPEVMSDAAEARAYHEGDFRSVNAGFVRRALGMTRAPRGSALDLGCGPGEIPILFARGAPDWTVTAVDLSASMLALARTNARKAGIGDRIRWLLKDAKTFTASERFDLVFSNSLLHHLDDPTLLWRRLGEWVLPGSAVLFMDLRRPRSNDDARAIVARHAGNASELLRQLFHQSLLAAFTPSELRSQLRAAGIDWLRVQTTTDRHVIVCGFAPDARDA
jgi:2-polyprenyl-3-methyl-5-hydroxy-6-metoxy-1,4-benzoquinol methylase